MSALGFHENMHRCQMYRYPYKATHHTHVHTHAHTHTHTHTTPHHTYTHKQLMYTFKKIKCRF